MSQALYDLPEGWVWKRLGDVTNNEKLDIVDGPFGSNLKSSEYVDEGIPILRLQNIDRFLFINKNIQYITEEKAKQIQRHSFVSGDVVITKLGSPLGKACIIPDDFSDGRIVADLVRVRVDERKNSKKFIVYAINSSSAIAQLESQTKGATRPRINLSHVRSLLLPLPPLAEQTRIVEKLDAVLSRIDTAIDELQQSLALVDAMFKSGLEGCFRLDGIKQVLLSDIATVGRGVSKHRPRNDSSLFGGNYPFIQTGDVRNAQKYIKKYSESYSDKGLAQSKLWKKGTICLTIAANIGDVAILDLDACFPDSVVGIYSETESNEYLYYFLSTLQSYLDLKANAAAQKNINLKILSEIEVPLPSLDRQQEIVDYLNALNDKTTQLKTELTAKIGMFNQLKASVLYGAFRREFKNGNNHE